MAELDEANQTMSLKLKNISNILESLTQVESGQHLIYGVRMV